MPDLQPLRADDASTILAFESANRGYFAAFISDRGDEYSERFTERYDALLADQEAGLGAYYVLADEDGTVLGRFNLWFAEPGVATLGYRVAQHVAGRGVATTTVRDLCSLAASRHASASYEPPPPMRTWPPSGCCATPASPRRGRPLPQTSAGSRACGSSGTSYSASAPHA